VQPLSEHTRTGLRARLVVAAIVLFVVLGLPGCAETLYSPSAGQIYVVRVVDRPTLEAAWRRENPARAEVAPSVVAFTKTGLICQIWLTPASASLAFGHEIRHCEEGHWHPER